MLLLFIIHFSVGSDLFVENITIIPNTAILFCFTSINVMTDNIVIFNIIKC